MQHRALRYRSSLLLGVALVSSGCGGATGVGSGGCSPRHVSVGEARSEQPKQVVQVEGHYLRKDGITRLCDVVIGSASPTCGGPSLVVRGYEPGAQVKIHHASGVAWTNGTVKIYGLVSGTNLRRAGCA